ncbi:type II toxin-antitoxin system VapC family toxin [Methylomonas sp. AM2-LC]|uniref:PIN domain-containing protein n=1 Tax=Methylomonas sp. AM2-LC TaxID=3153301 RepID=UPI003264ED00
MIGLDTNVLVRYITQDDPIQSEQANALLESLSTGLEAYITVVSLVELVWVLSSCYGSSNAEISNVLESLMHTKHIIVQNADIVWKALRNYKEGKADFPDCLIKHSSFNAGCSSVVTFDVKAARDSGMSLIGSESIK